MAVLAILPLHPFIAATAADTDPVVATYSIVALDPKTGELGVAVQSKFFGVGSVVPWAKAGVGAVASQAFANTSYGTNALALLASGKSPAEVLVNLTSNDPLRERRQVAIIDARGNVVAHTGRECMDWAGHRIGMNYSVQGNILAGAAVVDAMTNAFESSRNAGLPLPECLVAALQAAESAGGDKRGRQSAALLVVRDHAGFDGNTDRYVDLRVEDHPQPVEELTRLLSMHRKFYGLLPAPKPTPPAIASTPSVQPAQTRDTVPTEMNRPWIKPAAVVTALVLAWLFLPRGGRPTDLGVRNGRLKDCPDSPNCVSSQATDPGHKIDPLPFVGTPDASMVRVKNALSKMSGVKIVNESPGYLHAEFTTLLMRYVDDVEFYYNEAAKQIEVRSASRIGHSDLGKNRKRMEEFRKAFGGS
ncbi:MAG TPA: DUF1028 domain-containing protein [Roseimicrobium sp.]|nr:DUF1028 domain-containing protein [Roseimicrobium sp.]